MKTKTLQEQYNLIKEGKGNKEIFLKEAKLQFPHLIRNAANFTETTTILKQRSIISENILQLGLVTQNKKQDWFKIFNENINEQNLASNEEWSLEPEGRFWVVTYRTDMGKSDKAFPTEKEARQWIKDNLENNLSDKEIKRMSSIDNDIDESKQLNEAISESGEFALSNQELNQKDVITNKSIIDIYNIISEVDDIDFIQEIGFIISRKDWDNRREFRNKQNIYKEIQKHINDQQIINDLEEEYYKQVKAGRMDLNEVKEKVKPTKIDNKETNKDIVALQTKNYDYKDKSKTDNVYGTLYLNGFYAEMQNPKNADKTIDELKAIVTKNLTKDRLYYTTQTQFGIEGIGYTDQTPGYKPSKELKGKYKSSGYGDLDIDVEKIKANTKDNLSKKEAKTKMPSGVKEMPVTPKTVSGVKKMDMPGTEKTIKLKEGIGMFNDPIGYQKSELSNLDKMFTKEYKGNGIYVIYKNGEEVKTIEGEGNANAWINGEMRKLKEALSSSQLSQYANMSDQEIINWAKEDGMEDFIEYDELGQLSNHDELLAYLLGKEVDDDLDNDKEDMFGPGEFDPAGGRGLSSHLEESKKQSLKQSLKEKIKDIVKEILSEDNTLDEGAAEDKAAADAAKANATAQATAAQAAAKAAAAAATAAKKKEADVKADKNPGIPGAGG